MHSITNLEVKIYVV